MVTLHLGVLDVPYANGKATTGDVATILEDRYHIMEIFLEEAGRDAITDAFEHSAEEALQDLFSGASPASVSLTLGATEEIQEAFRVFLDGRGLDGIVPG